MNQAKLFYNQLLIDKLEETLNHIFCVQMANADEKEYKKQMERIKFDLKELKK